MKKIKKQEEICYEAIMNLLGADIFKEKMTDLRSLTLTKDLENNKSIELPVYFWVLKRGGGISTYVKDFTEYMSALGLVDFIGTKKYIMFRLEYTSDEAKFYELERLKNVIDNVKGMNRNFKGILCVDINGWIDFTNSKYFKDFLSFIRQKRTNILPIFYIHKDNDIIINKIESSLSAYLRFDTIRFNFPETSTLVDLVQRKYLQPEGFKLSEQATLFFSDMLKNIIENEAFNGFSTIEHIAKDILFFLHKNQLPKDISKNCFEQCVKLSNYINLLKSTNDTKKYIGFITNNKE
ncbi:MAG: hypothetical protein FWG20_01345 [Candidatus Cloacimonetes bacterium]|nr:hypothetical protein [Candidatus Cloacimonadota bacterium]